MTLGQTSFLDTFGELDESAESLCLFRCTTKGFPRSNILAVADSTHFFPQKTHSITKLFPYETQVFLCEHLYAESGYVLLLTKNDEPVMIATKYAAFHGLCLGIRLHADPAIVLTFLRTIPQIRVVLDPRLTRYTPKTEFDPRDFARLGVTFRRCFALFDAAPFRAERASDPFPIFRLFRMRIGQLAEMFGVKPAFLMESSFDLPMRENLTVDLHLMTLTSLLQFFLFRLYAMDERINVVFYLTDRMPSVCIHFMHHSDQYETTELLRYCKMLYEKEGYYFLSVSGDPARKEAEKIPGVRHAISHVPYEPIHHTLTVFSATRNNWVQYINRSPIFRLPEHFFLDTEEDEES